MVDSDRYFYFKEDLTDTDKKAYPYILKAMIPSDTLTLDIKIKQDIEYSRKCENYFKKNKDTTDMIMTASLYSYGCEIRFVSEEDLIKAKLSIL